MNFPGAYIGRNSVVGLSSISIATCCIVACKLSCSTQIRIFKLRDILTSGSA